jgi:hypothetical protein
MENLKKANTTKVEAKATMANKNVLENLKARTITAKLRDAVVISIQDSTGELGRYKNIELPDAIRDLPVEDFQFAKSIDGKLEFEIIFATGSLPKPMPEPRALNTRTTKPAPKEKVEAEKPKAQIVAGPIKQPEAPKTAPITPPVTALPKGAKKPRNPPTDPLQCP